LIPDFAGMTYNPTSFGSSLIKSAYKVTIAENPQSKPRPLSEDIYGVLVLNIEKFPEEANEFLSKIFGQLAGKTGDILSDLLDGSLGVKVKLWRYKRIVDTFLKARQYLHDKGVDPRIVPLKILHPLLESASLEDDGNMQEKWAALLANAADPKKSDDIHSSYIGILKQLTPIEAKILDDYYSLYQEIEEKIRWERTGFGHKSNFQVFKSDVCNNTSLSPAQFDLIACNLIRLNLLQLPGITDAAAITSDTGNKKLPLVIKTYEFVQLTPLREGFVKSCRYGRKN
jgi:hypothetical protein